MHKDHKKMVSCNDHAHTDREAGNDSYGKKEAMQSQGLEDTSKHMCNMFSSNTFIYVLILQLYC